MGTVWAGEQLALRRQVAVKSLRVAGAAQRARLRNEALALASLHHPAVVQVYDYGETEASVPFIVMELVRGETLAARLARAGALDAEGAVALVLPLLDGLTAAHAAGIVHRDLKPDNIVLTPGPAGPVPKLLDFGIAKQEGDSGPRLTVEGSFVGTPDYMAPEQLTLAPVDERTDVWGMAIVLYEMMAGRPPFAAPDMYSVMRGVVDAPPTFPRAAQGLDGRLWSILMGALRKDPAERTPSARALRDALDGWRDARRGVSPEARPASQAPRAIPASAPTLAAQGLERATTAPQLADDGLGSLDALIRHKLGD